MAEGEGGGLMCVIVRLVGLRGKVHCLVGADADWALGCFVVEAWDLI